MQSSRKLVSTVTTVTCRNYKTTSVLAKSFKVQDDKDFEEKVQNSKKPVLVDFFANWCGPCRALEPRLENVMAKRSDRITLAKVDIDSLGDLAAKYEVGTIPALVLFKNGKVECRLVGLQDEDKLSNWVDSALEEKK